MAVGYGYGGVYNGSTGNTGGLLGGSQGNNASSVPAMWSNGAPTTQNYNPNPGAYAYGLQDTFNTDYNPGDSNPYQNARSTPQNASSNDPDVAAAQNIANEESLARNGADAGVGFDADNALLEMYEGRIGAKNTIGQQIAENGSMKMGAIQEDQAAANTALGQGTNNTNSNYNSRGLLFSGAREAGDQQVRGQVASGLASSLAGTQQDYAQQLAASQNAYASVDLQGASQALGMATNAANTATQNNIARIQAMQQLGAGVGSAAGTVAGSLATNGNPATYINPAAGWDPSGSSGINTPYNGGNQFGGYLSDPSYSAGLGDNAWNSGNPYASPGGP